MRSLLPLLLSLSGVVACGSDGDAKSAERDDDAGAPFPQPVADDCITAVGAGVHDFECVDLDYRLTVPEACLTSACGVILDVHGKDMDGPQEELETGLAALGQQHGYLVIQPTANLTAPLVGSEPKPGWNFGADPPNVADFVERTIAAFHADENRIHVTGFSQGGVMTSALVCANPGRFASVAPAGAAAPSCDAMVGSGVDVIYMHGRADALAPFSLAEGSTATLRMLMGAGEGEIVSTDDQHDWTRYTGSDGTVLEFIAHDYTSVLGFLGGHCFPGSTSAGTLACKQAAAFAWGRAAMDFFIAHPKDD